MKLSLSPEIERDLREVIARDDAGRFIELASPLKWGKPSWSASQLLMQVIGDEEKRLRFWARNLSNQVKPDARRYAPNLLLLLWKRDKIESKRILTNLADDDDWLVREEAHGVWGELLQMRFEQVLPILKTFNTHSSTNLRRCVAIAARKAGNLRKDEWAEPLLCLLEPLLSDKTVYVRKNVGPYAIGDGLLRCYPSLTLKHLRRWARRRDEGTLWNVAMAFASFGGNKNWREGTRILANLAKDERRYVWRSVASSLLYLARRHTEVKDELKKWLSDSNRAKVAEEALKYLKAKDPA